MSPTPSTTPRARPFGPPPPAFLRKRWFHVVNALVVPPLLVLISCWKLLGVFMTLRPLVVAALSTALTWILYFCTPSISTGLIDWPIVATVGYAMMVLWSQSSVAKLAAVGGFIMAYGILRSAVYTADSPVTRHLLDASAVLAGVLPAWLAICSLDLWLPASFTALEETERRIYQKHIQTDFKMHVIAGLGTVHVPYCGATSAVRPRSLVLVHGYMAGNAFWIANLHELAKYFDVYAVEWKGIGRSVRPDFHPTSAEEMDAFFVESFEEWRCTMQLDRLVLCGHSMGATFSTYYADKYPQHVEHLVLVSPSGVNDPGDHAEDQPLWWRLYSKLCITPMSVVRFAGPLGKLLSTFILDVRTKATPATNILRSGVVDIDDFAMYSYHNWALKPSGDKALFTHLLVRCQGPQARPLCHLLSPSNVKVPVTFLYGGQGDWMPREHGAAVVQKLELTPHYAAFGIVPGAGHQLFMDNPTDFNKMLVDAVQAHERFRHTYNSFD